MIHGGRSNNGVTSRFWPSQSGHSKPEPRQKHEKSGRHCRVPDLHEKEMQGHGGMLPEDEEDRGM
jgi:hypothetical protein